MQGESDRRDSFDVLESRRRHIAHDRRGHGRSAQTGDGHDMDHYADDLSALKAQLDLKNAIYAAAPLRR